MSKRVLKVVYSSLFLIACPALSGAADLFGTIWFHGTSLPNAEISVTSDHSVVSGSRTNQFGYYSIRNLAPGAYRLSVKLPDNSLREISVDVFPQNTEKNIQLD